MLTDAGQKSVRMGEQGADFMGNCLLWKRDRELVAMNSL